MNAISPSRYTPPAAASTTAADGSTDERATATLLPEPGPSVLAAGSVADLALLLARADQQDSTSARKIEDAADAAASREEDARVDDLRAKASADENQGFAQGLGAIGEGVFAGLGASNLVHDSGLSTALSHALPGIGNIAAGIGKSDSDLADARAGRSEAQAQGDIRRYDQAHEDAQAADAEIQKVEQFLGQIQQTQNATNLSAATGRA